MPPTFEIAESESSLRFDLPDSVGLPKISIAIVDPDRERSKAVNGTMVVARTGTVRVVPGYLPTVQDAPWLTEQGFDMILVGLDGNTRDALRTVESLCTV